MFHVCADYHKNNCCYFLVSLCLVVLIYLRFFQLALSLEKNLGDLFREVDVSIKEMLATPATSARQKTGASSHARICM